jgi:DUF3037 family protein
MAPGRPFQYLIVRVVPRIERGEQLNAGVVVYSPTLDFLAARVGLDERRLEALAPDCDAAAVRPHLEAVAAIAAGDPAAGGPIAHLERGERFHWLAAPSSTMIQPSAIHTGFSDRPQETLGRLFGELVQLGI